MERLGDSDAFAEALLEILERNGWTVDRRRAFAGEGYLVTGVKSIVELRHSGATLADAAIALFNDAAKYFRLPDTQLELAL